MARNRSAKEFVVIGLGRFGSSIARHLEKLGCTVLAIDIDSRPVQEIADEVTRAVILDATSEEALAAVDISSFDTAIISISSDFEALLLATVAVKRLGVKRVLCKAGNDRQREILLQVGADRVVQPEQETGQELAHELAAPKSLEVWRLDGERCLTFLPLPEKLAWHQLGEVEEKRSILILAIKRKDDYLSKLSDDMVLQKGDSLVVLGREADVLAFR